MYTLDTARKVAARQSVLAGEERFVLFAPGLDTVACYAVVSGTDLETYYLGYRESDLLDCYVDGYRQ